MLDYPPPRLECGSLVQHKQRGLATLATRDDANSAVASSDESENLVGDSLPISERVRFWEEQDRINQELIPRVIRQHELLTQHIGEHEHLPTTLANAVEEGLARGHKELQEKYDAALESAKEDLTQQMESEYHQYRARVGNLVTTIVAAGGVIIIAATVAFNVLIG